MLGRPSEREKAQRSNQIEDDGNIDIQGSEASLMISGSIRDPSRVQVNCECARSRRDKVPLENAEGQAVEPHGVALSLGV